MADEQEQPERLWDEYDWERFLKQQDLKAELYLELMERFRNHPDRDVMVAREMGWESLKDEEARVWLEDLLGEEDLPEEVFEEGEDFPPIHPLHQRCMEYALWLDDLFEEKGGEFCDAASAVELSCQACLMGSKVAAALSDPEEDEIGMTIAYLKRALRAANLGLSAAAQLVKDGLLGRSESAQLRERLFAARDGIVEIIGQSRVAWRRLHGSGPNEGAGGGAL
jgi:hypothetical protein